MVGVKFYPTKRISQPVRLNIESESVSIEIDAKISKAKEALEHRGNCARDSADVLRQKKTDFGDTFARAIDHR